MNKSILTHTLIFSIGAAIGSVITWKICKDKYEKIANEEINQMRETYLEKKKYLTVPRIEKEEEAVEPEKKPEPVVDLSKYAARLVEMGYGSTEEIAKGESKKMTDNEPYVIEPGEFGQKDGYDEVTLFYFSDGTLTDENFAPILDIDDAVGLESLEHLGESDEDDSVYVRNDAEQTDYEIIYDFRIYSEVVRHDPYAAEDE